MTNVVNKKRKIEECDAGSQSKFLNAHDILTPEQHQVLALADQLDSVDAQWNLADLKHAFTGDAGKTEPCTLSLRFREQVDGSFDFTFAYGSDGGWNATTHRINLDGYCSYRMQSTPLLQSKVQALSKLVGFKCKIRTLVNLAYFTSLKDLAMRQEDWQESDQECALPALQRFDPSVNRQY